MALTEEQLQRADQFLIDNPIEAIPDVQPEPGIAQPQQSIADAQPAPEVNQRDVAAADQSLARKGVPEQKGFFGNLAEAPLAFGRGLKSLVGSTANVVKGAAEGFVEGSLEGAEQQEEAIGRQVTGEQGAASTALQTFASFFKPVTGAISGAVGVGLEELDEKALEGVGGEFAAEQIGSFLESDTGQGAMEVGNDVIGAWTEFKKDRPELANNIVAIGSIGEVLLDIYGGGVAKKAGKEATEALIKTAEKVGEKTGDALGNVRTTATASKKASVEAKVAKKQVGLSDRLQPKLTTTEKILAKEQGRVTPGKKKLSGGKRPDIVAATEEVQETADTVRRLIPDADTLDDFALPNRMSDIIADKADVLKPKLAKIVPELKPGQKSVAERVSDIFAKQADDPTFADFPSAKKAQEKFKRFITELDDASTGDDWWKKRIDYDNSIARNVKNATSQSSPALQLQKDIWLENREVFNGVLKDMTGKLGDEVASEFKDMNNLYRGITNMSRSVDIDTKGKDSILEKLIKRGAAGLATGLGIGAAF